MKKIGAIVALCSLWFMTACSGGNSESRRVAQQEDSIYTANNIYKVYGKDTRRALAMVDSALLLGTMDTIEAQMLLTVIYAQAPRAYSKPDSAIYYGERLLKNDSLSATASQRTADNRYNILSALFRAYRAKGNYVDLMRCCMELADLNRLWDNKLESLRNEAEVGYIMTNLGRLDEGLARLDSIIRLTDVRGSVAKFDIAIVAMRRMIKTLDGHGRNMEAIGVSRRLLARIADYERNPEAYAADSYLLTPEGDRSEVPRYCNFYKAQAYGCLANLYAEMHADLGESSPQPHPADSAHHYLRLFAQFDYGQSLDGRTLVIPVQRNLGLYDEMLATYSELEETQLSDTFNTLYGNMLYDKSVVAKERGQIAEAYGLMKRYALLSNQLDDSLQASSVQDYAARYHAKEQELKIQDREAAVERSNIVIKFLTIGLLVLLFFSYYAFRQKHIVSEKNHGLVCMIEENIKYKEQYEKLYAMINTKASEAGAEPSLPDLKNMSDKELFRFLYTEIVEKKLYLNPNLDRQFICDRYRLTAFQVGSAFSRGSEYSSLPDFVRDCRLEYALKLLSTTDMRINDVAEAAGFSRVTTFNHDFKARYNLSPTEYRKR